jgi:hypothetical protein
MSYNGSGTFQINTSGQPVVAGTVISATAFNALTADLATGLSTAITKDGQTTTTARIPFAAGISSTLTTDSSSVSTGSIITAGGVGVAKALYVGTTANVAGAVTLQSALSVTGVTTVQAGTAAAPAITTTGDTNTGIFFPAADTIAFSEGGVEAMRIDSSGNVGIGTSSPTDTSSYGRALDIQSSTGAAIYLRDSDGPTTDYGFVAYDSSIDSLTLGSITASTGIMRLLTAGAERARIDSSGNLLVNTTNAGVGGLSVSNAKNINFAEDATSAYATLFRQSSSAALCLNYGLQIGTGADTWASSIGSATARSTIAIGPGTIKFFTDTSSTVAVGTNITPTERARIDSSGNLLVNNTSGSVSGPGQGQAVIACSTSGKFALSMTNTNASGAYGLGISSQTGENIYLYYQGTYKGLVSTSAGGTTYGTTSDYRLKEKVQPMIGALEAVAQLKPCTYTWKEDGLFGQGFIAHELAEVCPQAVVGEKDAIETYTDEDGNEQTRPKYQSIDTSFLVATLTAALQEMKAIIDTQASTITTLTDRITALEAK